MINIILCGGVGSRLWPLSRKALPKQFVKLFEGSSLFQHTVHRNKELCNGVFIVSNTEQYFLALDQLIETRENVQEARFLLEAVGRNTAPAIALACLELAADDLVLVTTSDHLVKDLEAYKESVLKAKALAEKGFLVTFGIRPGHADEGFGYIQASGNDVVSFKEKPSLDVAASYIEEGNYFWNSGMFCFKAGVFLEELAKHSPDIYDASEKVMNEIGLSDTKSEEPIIRINLDQMLSIPEDSIDYAVMEKSNIVKVIPCDMGWSDLGSFDSLYEEAPKDLNGNAVLPRLETSPPPICIGSKNNLLVTRDRQLALVDVEGLLVVDTSDAVLISKKGSSQKVKQVVSKVKEKAPQLAEIHRLAHRPWGTYEVLVESDQHKVKRIVVKPGSKLSLQKHFHRNEHWIVVSGTASVTVDQESFLVRANESTYIQMGQVHRLENEGKIDLVMIEVQVGEYTGEDDIVRVEDIYGR